MKFWLVSLGMLLVAAIFACATISVMLDGWKGMFIRVLGGDDTVHSEQYSDIKFLRIKPGMSSEEVEEIIGLPLIEVFECHRQDAGQVLEFRRSWPAHVDPKYCAGGQGSLTEALRRCPNPTVIIWKYTCSEGNHRIRAIRFAESRVTESVSGYWLD